MRKESEYSVRFTSRKDLPFHAHIDNNSNTKIDNTTTNTTTIITTMITIDRNILEENDPRYTIAAVGAIAMDTIHNHVVSHRGPRAGVAPPAGHPRLAVIHSSNHLGQLVFIVALIVSDIITHVTWPNFRNFQALDAGVDLPIR